MHSDRKLPQSLSVVMPVFNEEGVIVQVVHEYARILQQFEQPEFIVVNDGSTDSTFSLLESLKDDYPFLQVINSPKNMGHGPSLLKAYNSASGDFVLHSDSDNQCLSGEFWLLWDELKEKSLDVVIGYRKERQEPFARILLTNSLRVLLLLLFRLRLPDSNSSFRLLSRGSLDKILPLIPENSIITSILMTLAAYKLKLKVGWVRVRHQPRLTGKSLLRSWKIWKLCIPALREVLYFRKNLAVSSKLVVKT